MQLQADVVGIPVVRPAVRGAYASLADFSSLRREDRTFEPEWTADRHEAAYRGWSRAVHHSRGWLEP